MTTLRQVVKSVLEQEGLSGNATSVATTLTEALNEAGYGIHEKARCVRLPKYAMDLGREMSPAEQRVLLGTAADGAESPSTDAAASS